MAQIYLSTGNLFSAIGIPRFTRADNPKAFGPSNILPVTQVVSVQQIPLRISVSHTLTLSQQARRTNIPLTASNTLAFSQHMYKGNKEVAANFLTLTHSAKVIKAHEKVKNTIIFGHVARVGRGIKNKITLTQSLTLKYVKVHAPSHVLVMQSMVSVYKFNDPDFVLGG